MLCIRVLSCNIHVYRFSFHTIINPPASIQNSTYSKRVTQFPTPILIDRDHPLTHPHVTTQTTSELVRADPQWGSTQPISNPHLRLSSTPTPTTPRQQPLRQLPPTTSQDDSRVRLVLPAPQVSRSRSAPDTCDTVLTFSTSRYGKGSREWCVPPLILPPRKEPTSA